MSTENTIKDGPIWVFPHKDDPLCEEIIREFRLHPVMAQILVSRGFKTLDEVHHYLYSKLPSLYDPYLMSQMDKAVDRICKALENNENILIYGDNDVDGMTSTALLVEFLRSAGIKTYFFVSSPTSSRNEIIIEALEYAVDNQCRLMITVDCGITCASQIEEATKQGVEVIVTDHHEPTETLPQCVAILNPKLESDNYPNRDLTGVGVTFKLAHGIINHLSTLDKLPTKKIDLKRLLDLVALGTISDMGPLLGENRILVRYGLQQMQKGSRIGLGKLMTISDVDPTELTPGEIGSKIAPRLNSLGRIADPQKGVELLLVRHTKTAEKIALELDLNNIERQKIDRSMSLNVDTILQENPNITKDKAIVMASENWHPGLIAILSTRISKQFNRPTVMISVENGIGKGSIRSIPEFPLLSALKECSDLLNNFGGHDFAAGLTLKQENIPEFRKRFAQIANSRLSEQDILSKLYLDAPIQFKQLTFDFMESMKLFEPYGHGNNPPVLFCNAKQAWPPKVIGKTHLKFYLEQGDRMLEGIAFGMASQNRLLRKKDLRLRIAFTPQINTFQNKPSIQLIIKDFNIITKVATEKKETSSEELSKSQ